MENDTATYTGITKQSLVRRLYQHNHNVSHPKNFTSLEPQVENLTRNQARAIEQYYIMEGPNQMNMINSISPDNPFYHAAYEWAKAFWGH